MLWFCSLSEADINGGDDFKIVCSLLNFFSFNFEHFASLVNSTTLNTENT